MLGQSRFGCADGTCRVSPPTCFYRVPRRDSPRHPCLLSAENGNRCPVDRHCRLPRRRAAGLPRSVRRRRSLSPPPPVQFKIRVRCADESESRRNFNADVSACTRRIVPRPPHHKIIKCDAGSKKRPVFHKKNVFFAIPRDRIYILNVLYNEKTTFGRPF